MTHELQLSHWSQTSPLRYRKEAIYEGVWPAKSGGKVPVTGEILKHVAKNVGEIREAGWPIPLTKGTPHQDWSNPSNKLGEVVGASVATNPKGKAALYLDVVFANEADRDLALKSEVSVSIEPSFEIAGRSWIGALTHLASTAAPRVPDLAPFVAIAASFNSAKPTYMSKILEHFGVESEELALSKIEAMETKIAELETPKVELSHSPLLVRTIRDARELQLSALVSAGEISPAAKAEILKYHGTDKAVGLELSQSEDGAAWDAVLNIAKVCSKAQPVAPRGRSTTPPNDNGVELSHNGNSDKPSALDAALAAYTTEYNGRFNRNGHSN